MAGVAIQLAWQGWWRRVCNVVCFEPGCDRGLDLLIPSQACRVEQVLVERTDEHEHAVASRLKDLNHALKRLPLQGFLQIHPGIVLLGYAALVPGLRQMPASVVQSRKILPQRLKRVIVGMLQSPAGKISALVVSLL